jgi:Tc toxin complex TcA C-terminal TcB-binding domain
LGLRAQQVYFLETPRPSWLQLRESGTCQFRLPEILFNLDFPGHYNRRIKSVDLTIPCVVGPFAQANCTLRLLSHQYRISSAETSGSNYEEQTAAAADPRFQTCVVPISAIATSSGVNDAGVFELNFHVERYLPFEGAGVISTWELDLPDTYVQFDYATITDVIMHINYTSLDGGALLTSAAKTAVKHFVQAHQDARDLYTIFDLPNEFPEQWQSAVNTADGKSPTMVFDNIGSLIPIYSLPMQKTPPTIQFYVHFLSSGMLTNTTLTLLTSNEPASPTKPSELATVSDFNQYQTTTPLTLKENQPWQVKMDSGSKLDRMWMLVRYWYYYGSPLS